MIVARIICWFYGHLWHMILGGGPDIKICERCHKQEPITDMDDHRVMRKTYTAQ